MEKTVKAGLVGSIKFQNEIYVSVEAHGYVRLTTDPGSDDVQMIDIHVANIDSLIALLAAAKRDSMEE